MKREWSVLALAVVFAACAGSNETPAPAKKEATPAPSKAVPAPTPAPAAEATHGVAGAAPGSYEDWCGEHAVPESMCTRCNPTLIAAFKATGDWCVEHGLPESQCLLCNPTLKIERPPKPEGM